MAELLVRDWLAEYKALSPTEVSSFSSTTADNLELIQALFTLLEDKNRHNELLEPVCNQLFSFYRSLQADLQSFALQYLPTLIGVYLCSLVTGERRRVKCIEVLLLGVYNLEVVDASGKPTIRGMRLPSLAQPSIYHTPMSFASATLTENALSRLDKGDVQLVRIGPFPQVENINAQNRMKVMTLLMTIYNGRLSQMTKAALQALCKMCIRVVKQGFGKGGTHHRSYSNDGMIATPYQIIVPRVPVSSSFLLELLHAVYFAIFNGFPMAGLQAVEDISSRAAHEMMPDVLMVSSSIHNSVKLHPSGVPCEGPMGISVALSPTTSTTTVSKTIITNASFRTRKLPDDIPIQIPIQKVDSTDNRGLTTIGEEDDDNRLGGASNRGKEKDKAMAPLMGMIAKMGDKSKKESKKSIDSDLVPQPSASRSREKAERQLSATSDKEAKRKESVDAGRSSRRDSGGLMPTRGGVQNGDTVSLEMSPMPNSKMAPDDLATNVDDVFASLDDQGSAYEDKLPFRNSLQDVALETKSSGEIQSIV